MVPPFLFIGVFPVKGMAKSVTIRRLTKGDCDSIVSLRDELALSTNREPKLSSISAYQLENDAFADPPLFHCLLATTKSTVERSQDFDNNTLLWKSTPVGSTETIVGYATYVIGYPIWEGKEIALQELIVTKNWRGKGVGKQLLQELAKIAIEGNYARISVNCLANIPAANFFKSQYGLDMTLSEDWHTLRIEKNHFHKLAQ